MAVADPPTYETIESHADLIAWSSAYAREVRRDWNVDVRLDLVEWEVSTRARRRAAAVKRPKLEGATIGEPFDWDAVEGADGRPLPCTVSLTWDAFDVFRREEWAETLRHELVHVEQFQQFGTTDHGTHFEQRAAALDTTVTCRAFAEPRWTIHCTECGAEIARRYRDCKLVKNADSYRSNCCGAPLEAREHESA
jgi:hypothetical protein